MENIEKEKKSSRPSRVYYFILGLLPILISISIYTILQLYNKENNKVDSLAEFHKNQNITIDSIIHPYLIIPEI